MEVVINQSCFCGSKNIIRFYNPTSDVYKIGCSYCGRQGSPARSAEKAILNWLNFMASELDQQDRRIWAKGLSLNTTIEELIRRRSNK